MAYAMFTDSKEKEVTLIRESKRKISIITEVPLNDDQMHDLYWIVLLMEKTGKRLKDFYE